MVVSVFLLAIMFFLLFGVKRIGENKEKAQPVIDSINQIIGSVRDSINEIAEAEILYNSLSKSEKKYVSNSAKLKGALKELNGLKIELTEENISKYIDISVSISNYSCEEEKVSIQGYSLGSDYIASADLSVKIKPNVPLQYKDVRFSVDLDIGYRWNGGYLSIRLDKNGEYEYEALLNTKTSLLRPTEPSYSNTPKFSDVSGYLVYK